MDYLFSPVGIAFMACIGAAAATMIGTFSIVGARASNPRLLAFGLAFAGGAMVYISLVEIFVQSHLAFGMMMPDKDAYALATLTFFAGMGLMAVLDHYLPNPHLKLMPRDPNAIAEHGHTHGSLFRVGLFATLAITAHNLPEGMATFFATLDNPGVGMTLAFAIAVHNIPEGVSIAIPVYYATGSKRAAVLATLISALAEPLGALIGYVVLAPFLTPAVYGALFGMIAGAMVYLALDELLPTARRYAKGHETLHGMVTGMAVLALSLVLFK